MKENKLARIGLLLRMIALAGLFILSNEVNAKKISKEEVVKVGKLFFSNNLDINNPKVESINEVKSGDLSCYYQINFVEGGWIIIASDDRSEPILGYSKEGSFQLDEKQQVNIAGWLNSYEHTLKYIITNNEDVANPAWTELETEKRLLKSTQSSVSPLIVARWNQGRGFNQFCPVDVAGPDGHAYVGCVAVAMGQAMHVSKQAIPQGFKTYNHEKYGTIFVNYNQEPQYDWSAMSTTSGNAETARLLFHCGVAVEMGYGADGSGAYSSDVARALRTYFGYSSQCEYIPRIEDQTKWLDILYNELDNNRPIIYSGNAPEGGVGHSFNVDGYDTNGLFHINWGWGGANNGYYNINMFKDGDQDYTANQEIIIGLGEAYMGPTNINLSSTEVKENMPVGTFVANVSVEDLTEGDTFMFQLFGAPLYGGGYRPSKFYIEDGKLLTSVMFNRDDREMEKLTIQVMDRELNTFQKDFEITILENGSTDIHSSNENEIKIYPNPIVNQLNVVIEDNLKGFLNVFTTTGELVLSKKITNSKTVLNVDHLANGMYFIVIKDEKGSHLYSDIFVKL